MISEAEAIAALPPWGFVRNFTSYAWQVTEAPAGYHLFSALSVMAPLVPAHVELFWGGRLPCTFWTMLIGDSGEARKTSAANLAVRILADVDDTRLGEPNHESVASMVEAMAASPTQLMFMGEFGDFLKGTKEGSYRNGIRDLMLALWDGNRYAKQSLGKGLIVVEKPRLSILAAVAPPLLEKSTNEDDWSGGFISRWAIVAGANERKIPVPTEQPDVREALVKQLAAFANTPIGPLVGMSAEAQAIFTDWSEHKSARLDRTRWSGGLIARADTIALKAAMIHSCDWGAGRRSDGGPWELDPEAVYWGCRIADLHLRSTSWAVDHLAVSGWARMRRSVLDAISGEVVTLADVLRRVQPKMSKRNVEEVLDSLVAEDLLVKTTGMPTYWSPAAAARPTATQDNGQTVPERQGNPNTPVAPDDWMMEV